MSRESDADRLLGALARARSLVERDAPDADRRGALSADVVHRLIDDRLLRLFIPRRYDGFELALPAALEIYEAAARIDGALGWAVMIGAGGGLFAAYLDEDTAREIFGPANAVVAGSGAPEGRAERVPGGYRVTGQWRYASGAPYATTFTANCIVTSDEEPARTSDGGPLVRAMAFAREDVEILDTWDAIGMRATSSHDFRVRDVFVPERRSFSVFTGTPREPGPLYRLPFDVLTELPVLAVALGIARRALDELASLAAGKTPLGSSVLLAEDPIAAEAYARAHASWRAARSGAFALAGHAWEAAVEGRELGADDRAEITAVCAHGVALLRAGTDGLVACAGMHGIARASSLARAARDLVALGGHFSVSPRRVAAAGAALLDHRAGGTRD